MGQGADVTGPLPAATSRHARGQAGFPATWLAGGPWPARGPVHVPAGSRPPTPEDFDSGGAPDQGRLPAAGLS